MGKSSSKLTVKKQEELKPLAPITSGAFNPELTKQEEQVKEQEQAEQQAEQERKSALTHWQSFGVPTKIEVSIEGAREYKIKGDDNAYLLPITARAYEVGNGKGQRAQKYNSPLLGVLGIAPFNSHWRCVVDLSGAQGYNRTIVLTWAEQGKVLARFYTMDGGELTPMQNMCLLGQETPKSAKEGKLSTTRRAQKISELIGNILEEAVTPHDKSAGLVKASAKKVAELTQELSDTQSALLAMLALRKAELTEEQFSIVLNALPESIRNLFNERMVSKAEVK